MTIADSRSDRERKAEPSPPRTVYDPYLDAYSSWLAAIEAMHERMVALSLDDHDNRMPEDWTP